MSRWMLIVFTAAAFGLGAATAQPPTPIGPPTPVIPPPIPKPAPMPSATPVVVIPEYGIATAPATGCSTCGSHTKNGPHTKIGQKIEAHFSKERPAPANCTQCGTFACEWRFFLGSCRAFFDEGRFAPALPPVPPR